MLPNLVVLVVEDHPEIRNSLEQVVSHWPGHRIFSADNFLTAAVWIKSVKKIDLLLCEVHLPGEMGGIEIANLAVAAHPEIAVVMTSSESYSDVKGLIDRFKFVRKPFNRCDMDEAIDEAFIQINVDRGYFRV